MTLKKFPCFLLCALLIMNGCARLTVSERPFESKAPPPSPLVSQGQADSYYDYLLGQYFVRTNKIDQAVEAYTKALKDRKSVV
jgi:hypothetical protein